MLCVAICCFLKTKSAKREMKSDEVSKPCYALLTADKTASSPPKKFTA